MCELPKHAKLKKPFPKAAEYIYMKFLGKEKSLRQKYISDKLRN